MRKLTSWISLLLLTVGVLVPATLVFAAYNYSISIRVYNNSATSYSNGLPVLVTLNNSQLAALGYVGADGLDTDVVEGATGREFMVQSSYLGVFFPNFSGGQARTVEYYLGNTPEQTTLPVITGVGGNVTKSDDPDMELGSDFEIEFKGYIDTSTACNGTLVYKEDAFMLYVQASEAIRAAVLGAGGVETYAVTATGVTSGVRTVDVVADGATLAIYVYDEGSVLIDSDSILVNEIVALSSPVLLTKPPAASWGDIDVSSYIPAGATGVLLHIVNDTGGSVAYGLRKKGSTDDRRTRLLLTPSHTFPAVGVNTTSRIFQIWSGSSSADFEVYLIGYTESGVTFFTNAVDKTIHVVGAWTGVDCSGDVPVGTIAVILEVSNSGAASQSAFRKAGSTDDRTVGTYRSATGAGSKWWTYVGVNASRAYEQKIGADTFPVFLVGYITEGAVFKTNADDISPVGTGWTDTSLYTEAPNGAMAFVEMNTWLATYYEGIRKHGSSEETARSYSTQVGVSAVDSDQHLDVNAASIAPPSVGFHLVGYVLWDGVPNNGNDWYFADSIVTQSVLYFDSMELSVDDSVVVQYEPNTMISGSVLTDRQGGNENGTINWGSNPGGLEITLSGLGSAAAPTSSATSTEESAPNLLNPPPVVNSAPDTGESDLLNMPLYPSVNATAVSLGMTTKTAYVILMWITCMVLGVAGLVALGSGWGFVGGYGFGSVLGLGTPVWPQMLVITAAFILILGLFLWRRY